MEKKRQVIRKPVMVDRSVDAMLLNRWVAFCTERQYDQTCQERNHIVTKTRSWYQVQWANIKADVLGFLRSPFEVAPRVAYSILALFFILLGKKETAHYVAFDLPMFIGAIAFDAAAESSHSGEPTTITVSITIGSGSDRFVTANYSGLGGGLSATFDGNAMRDIITQSPTEAAYYIAPGTGSKDVVVSGGNIKVLGIVSFTGVDQTDPIGAATRENGSASPNDMTMTTIQDGSVRVDVLGTNRDDSTSPTGTLDSGTLRCDPVTPQNQFRIGLYLYTNPQATAGSDTHQWTTSGTSRYYLAYEVRAAISGYTVLTLRPTGAGNEMQWDAEGGDYTRVDEASSDGDTTRLYTPTDNRRAVFAMADHTSETGTIYAVRVHLMMKGLDDIENTVRASIRTNSTNYESPDMLFKNNTYHEEIHYWLTNPNTGSAWTWSEIDALQAGMYRVSGGGQAVTQVWMDVLYSSVTIDDVPVTDSGSGADTIGILSILGIADANTGAAYSNGYGYRKSITIDNTKVAGSSDFTDFPILIKSTDNDLKSESNGGKVKNGTHLDIRFETAGGTQLKHEIESYDAATGALVAHVKIPTLGATADTTIYMYFGKTISATEQDPTAVWNSGYLAVYHLNNNGNDSTANALHLTNSGSSNATGIIAGGKSYDGTNDKDYRSHASIMDILEVTLESLVNLDAGSGSGEKGVVSHTHYNLITNETGAVRMEVNTSVGGYASVWTSGGGSGITPGTPAHIHGTYNKTTLKVFVEGVEQGSTAKTGDITAGTYDLNIGLHSAGYWDGLIDETRVHSVARSADYMLTSRNTLKDPATFYTLGSTVAGGVDPDAVDVTEVDTTSEKNVTDSGSGSDALTLLAQIAIAETATGADVISILALISLAESGSATDTTAILALIPIADSATATDTIQVAVFIPVSDDGSGTEAIVILAQIGVSETGSGDDAVDAEQTADTIAISDNATGNDVVSILAQLGITDLAVGTDVQSILALIGIVEDPATVGSNLVSPAGDMEGGVAWSGFNTEAGDTIANNTTKPFTGTRSMEVTVDAVSEGIRSNNIAITAGKKYLISARVWVDTGVVQMNKDTGNLVFTAPSTTTTGQWERLWVVASASASVNAQLRFLATSAGAHFFVDDVEFYEIATSDAVVITAMINLSESATATDVINILAQLGISETASAVDTIAILVQAGIIDSATGQDAIALLAQVNQNESGQGNDQTAITANVNIPETGAGDDTVGNLGLLNVTDIGAGVDSESIFAFLNINDTGIGADVPLVVVTGTLNLIKTVLKTNKKHTVLRQKMHSVILKQRRK